MKSSRVIFSVLSMSIAFAAQAGSSAGSTACPPTTKASIDVEFGAGTSTITRCLANRDDVNTVVNFSSNALHKSGVAQQLKNVENMADNYENMYGLRAGKQYKIVVVGHGSGGRFLLSDEAYNATYSVTTGNPSRALVEALVARGVTVYMCQNTMRGNGWKTADIIPGVVEVPSGVTAVVDFAKSGYVPLTP